MRNEINNQNHYYAIIPAAGQSTRMGMDSSKQFIELNGKPVIARTLLIFEKAAHIEGIVVVCKYSEIERIQEICDEYNITKLLLAVEGGSTRQISVRNGLETLSQIIPAQIHDSSYVLIHDGARPFLTQKILDDCLETVTTVGACICAVPVKDTIKKTNNNKMVTETIPRENLWAVQTPQAFKFEEILSIHKKAVGEINDSTDDASLAEYFGIKVHIVNGDYTNIKITTKEDLLFGEKIIASDPVSHGAS